MTTRACGAGEAGGPGGPGGSGGARLALLHLCDSLFPTGGFAHSDGLEAAVDAGHVRNEADLVEWLAALRDQSVARTEAPAVLMAWTAYGAGDAAAIIALDDEVYALRPAAAARQATRGMGGRLLKTWRAAYPSAAFDALLPPARSDRLTFPVAFGVACAAAQVGRTATIEGYAYARLAACVSAAMRLMPLGQHRAHGLLAASLAAVPQLAAALVDRPQPPQSFTPLLDIVAMQHQHVRSTLFRS